MKIPRPSQSTVEMASGEVVKTKTKTDDDGTPDELQRLREQIVSAEERNLFLTKGFESLQRSLQQSNEKLSLEKRNFRRNLRSLAEKLSAFEDGLRTEQHAIGVVMSRKDQEIRVRDDLIKSLQGELAASRRCVQCLARANQDHAAFIEREEVPVASNDRQPASPHPQGLTLDFTNHSSKVQPRKHAPFAHQHLRSNLPDLSPVVEEAESGFVDIQHIDMVKERLARAGHADKAPAESQQPHIVNCNGALEGVEHEVMEKSQNNNESEMSRTNCEDGSYDDFVDLSPDTEIPLSKTETTSDVNCCSASNSTMPDAIQEIQMAADISMDGETVNDDVVVANKLNNKIGEHSNDLNRINDQSAPDDVMLIKECDSRKTDDNSAIAINGTLSDAGENDASTAKNDMMNSNSPRTFDSRPRSSQEDGSAGGHVPEVHNETNHSLGTTEDDKTLENAGCGTGDSTIQSKAVTSCVENEEVENLDCDVQNVAKECSDAQKEPIVETPSIDDLKEMESPICIDAEDSLDTDMPVRSTESQEISTPSPTSDKIEECVDGPQVSELLNTSESTCENQSKNSTADKQFVADLTPCEKPSATCNDDADDSRLVDKQLVISACATEESDNDVACRKMPESIATDADNSDSRPETDSSASSSLVQCSVEFENIEDASLQRDGEKNLDEYDVIELEEGPSGSNNAPKNGSKQKNSKKKKNKTKRKNKGKK